MIEISNILTIAGISIVLFQISLFLRSIRDKRVNILLILILLAFIPLFLTYNLYLVHEKGYLFKLMAITVFSLVLIGPLLYEYSFHFFTAKRQKLFEEWKRYIPFFVMILLLAGGYFLLSKKKYQILLMFCMLVAFVHLVYYLVVLLRYQLKSIEKLKQFYVNLSNKNLFWINILIIGLVLLLVLDSFSGVIMYLTGYTLVPIINTCFLIVLVWFLGYHGLTQMELNPEVAELEVAELEPTETTDEKTDVCASEEYQLLKQKLIVELREHAFYKKENSNLNMLAQQLHVSSKKVSFVINHCLNTSFYELMNAYRLQEFKERLERGEGKEKTILALAFESGFSSKASFNRIFKQKEGITPNQYLKSLQ